MSPEVYVNTAYLNSIKSKKPEGIDDKSYLAILKYYVVHPSKKFVIKKTLKEKKY